MEFRHNSEFQNFKKTFEESMTLAITKKLVACDAQERDVVAISDYVHHRPLLPVKQGFFISY